MKTITTKHTEIGYTANVKIISDALREQFGFDDQSHILLAVAAHIWSHLCAGCAEQYTWGVKEIDAALEQCTARLQALALQLGHYRA